MEVSISVILPVYNVELYINDCINSLLKQSDSNFELIIINDGSTDKSFTVIEDDLKKFKDVKIIKHDNKGLAESRNIGIKKSKGNYVTFVDSDDTISEDYIKTLRDKALKDNSDFVIANHIVFSNRSLYPSDDYFVGDKYEVFKNFLACRVSSSVCAKLIKKSVFVTNNISFPKGYLFEDVATTYKIAFYSSKISFVDKYIYYYNQKREKSITNNIKLESIKFLMQIFEDTKEFLLKNKIFEDFKSYYIERCLIQLLVKFNNLKDDNDKIETVKLINKSDYFNTPDLIQIKKMNFNLYLRILKFQLDYLNDISIHDRYEILYKSIDNHHIQDIGNIKPDLKIKKLNTNESILITYKPFVGQNNDYLANFSRYIFGVIHQYLIK